MRRYKIRELSVTEVTDYSKDFGAEGRDIKVTKIILDGIGDPMAKADTLYLHVPYTDEYKLGQEFEFRFSL